MTVAKHVPVWRLIPLLEAPGRVQMAIDRWLLDQHQRGLHPPALRFYTWSPSAISLGYHQSTWPEHWQQLTKKGAPVELVRRPTGGRAVLHQGDLTYAVVTSGLTGSRIQVYQTICEFLIQGWLRLGVELHYGCAGRGYIHNPSCFGTATGADLVLADGSKFIGSAQLRRAGAILQHGSIRLEPDTELFAQVFGAESFNPIQLPLSQRGEALIQTACEALIAAAGDCFGVQLVLQPLCESEWEAILAQPSLEKKAKPLDLSMGYPGVPVHNAPSPCKGALDIPGVMSSFTNKQKVTFPESLPKQV